jgi:hypothetical protein
MGYQITEKEIRWISLYFSLIIMNYIFSIIIVIFNSLLPDIETRYVKGITYDYTNDSVFVNVPWLIEYQINISDEDINDFNKSLNNIADSLIEEMINNISYSRYLEVCKKPSTIKEKNHTITIFNKTNYYE